MAMFNRLKAKDKGPGYRLVFIAVFSCFWLSMWAIPFANRGSAHWITLVFFLCIGFLWAVGRKYLRITLALLIMALSIVLTFGLLGVQQTASARINGWRQPNGYYIQYTEPDAPPPEYDTITALVSEPDTLQFAIYDEVSITYRKVSLFGLHIGTFVDYIDSAPVIGAGSRHVAASHAWLPILFGTLPIVSLSGLYLYKRYHPGKGLAVETN